MAAGPPVRSVVGDLEGLVSGTTAIGRTWDEFRDMADATASSEVG